MLIAGVDVGGTNIEVGLVGDGHRVVARARRDTPRGLKVGSPRARRRRARGRGVALSVAANALLGA
ncbi:hypothetical protein FSW04_12435 [Baekduia soli]|uniref:ROK family protein n=1 Tax=Baekduia soli TaxID=496014 RepID=A0A5B8U5N3_9ACTN|nr:hypothetical protein [Baekduia soli]QEC48297.1 hypothetical protein FSW04_12435 [Baekduia soli]